MFKKLKRMFKKETLLIPFNFRKKIFIKIDLSDKALGSVISQKNK